MSSRPKKQPKQKPESRFAEFQNAEGWIETELKRIAKPVSKNATHRGHETVLTLSGENGLVHQGDYFGKKIAGDNTERYIKIVQNDFVYNDRTTKASTYGTIKRLSKYPDGLVSPIYKCFRFIEDECPNFWEYYFASGVHDSQLHSLINEGARAGRFNISVDKFLSATVWRPNPEEQQKIADCLSSLDELITAEDQKLDALQKHKKKLMQELFPREDETQPRLRFSNDGDWNLHSLPEFVFFQEGPGIMAVDFRSEGVPLVRLAGVGGKTVTLNGCNYLDPEKVAQKWVHFRLAPNDIIISTSATFGLVSIVTDVASGAVFYTGLIRLRPTNQRLNSGYLKAFLGGAYFEKQAKSSAVGGGIKHFGPTHLKQMKIPIPPLAEQQRIADFLLSIDDLITAQSQKVDALRAHKRGMMQKLFPTLSNESEN